MVINYREQDVVEEIRKIAPDGVDTIVEVSAARNAAVDAELIGSGGTVASTPTTAATEVSVPIRPTDGAQRPLAVRPDLQHPRPAKARAVDDVAAAAAQGDLRVGAGGGPAAAPLPAGRAAEAQQAVQDSADRQGPDHHQRRLTPQVSSSAWTAPSAYRGRTTFLSNLPTLVFGTASMNAQRSGSCQRATVRGEEVAQLRGGRRAPSRSTTVASGRSPHRSSGTPTTQASSTAGWAISAFSSSTEEIHSPPDLITSLARSVSVR